ncbi:unnamed protein product [Allacma fusca]|uniref:CUB domain-containing protein n=1 Tax=Allacma fusca TaxID=39272 RepID=A0A8J2PGB0_9HEXA|nr:unnamed protein product [Allacma fusca]
MRLRLNIVLLLFFNFIYLLTILPSAWTKTDRYELSSLCKGQYPTKMHHKIDAAVIVSKNDKNLECTVTFNAEYVSQRFLIRFDDFNMDCGDKLLIYDSANDVGAHRAELTCRYLSPEHIGTITTRGHYVTLKFVADGFGTDSNRFTMVITAFKDVARGCHDSFLCSHNNANMCISTRLLCDGISNCGNGEDELRSANCTGNFLMDFVTAVGDSPLNIAIISGLLVISTVIVVLCSCFCQRRQNNRRSFAPQPDIHNHSKNSRDPHGSNGAGTMMTLTDKSGMHSLHAQSTIESLQKSGNLHLPAASQGYTHTTHLLLRLRPCFMRN